MSKDGNIKPEIIIIYIASPSYSGSTLLSRLLHAHSQFVSVGEHRVLSAKVQRDLVLEKRACTCGVQSIKNCSFWQAIEKELTKENQITLETLDLNTGDDHHFKLHNQAFFESIRKVTGNYFIVDSSKNLDRLVRLREAGFKVIPIRLQREVFGVVNSGIKYGKHWLKESLHYWTFYQELYGITGTKIARINYGRLTKRPQLTLKALMPKLGAKFEEGQLDWATVPCHYIGGNPMRYQKISQIQVDKKWKKELSWIKIISLSSLALLCLLPEAWQFGLFQLFTKKSNANKHGH